MTWLNFYLFCFVVGLLLTLLSIVLGDVHFHVHLPFDLHFGHVDFGHVDVGHGAGHAHAGGNLPFVNFGTITAFLAWFGAGGYLATKHSHLFALGALGVAGISGLLGSTIVFLLLSKVLLKHEKNLDPSDYDMVGVLGRISSSIAEHGTGEIVYSQEGTRHTCGARSEDGLAIAKGAEVVVTRYERGIAYVRRWEELTATDEGEVQSASQ
jgi:membrane protein implicated in regulation of membrane protease activity